MKKTFLDYCFPFFKCAPPRSSSDLWIPIASINIRNFSHLFQWGIVCTISNVKPPPPIPIKSNLNFRLRFLRPVYWKFQNTWIATENYPLPPPLEQLAFVNFITTERKVIQTNTRKINQPANRLGTLNEFLSSWDGFQVNFPSLIITTAVLSQVY